MVEVGARRRGEHDARTVVVGEDHVPLDRPGRDHDPPGPDLPEALARQLRRRIGEVVGDPLDEADEILRIVAEGRGAQEEAHIRHRREPRRRALRPLEAFDPLDLHVGLVAQRPAGLGLLVADDDARPGLRRRERRRKPRQPAADHQHVAMGVATGVVIRIRLRRGDAEAGRRADLRLVEALPGLLRPHEGLVVEASREHRRHAVVHRPHVEGERRPAVLRGGIEPVIDLLHGRPHVRLPARGIAPHPDERVRFLRTRREDAARPVVLERPPDEMDAVGEKRRGERIAGERRVARPVEGEARRLRRRQPAGAGNAIGPAHYPVSPLFRFSLALWPAMSGFGSPAA